MKKLFSAVTAKAVIGMVCLYCLTALIIPVNAKGDFTAYNDCVYDPGLVGYGTDPCGQSVHYGDPNYITVLGVGQPAGDHQVPPAVGYAASSGELIDYATGLGTGVTATLTQSGDGSSDPNVIWQPQVLSTWTGGYDPAPGTDAYNTFNGIVDMTGVIYYASAVGWWVDVEFTGLDPNKSYTFATSASRAKDRTDGGLGYTNRLSVYTISGVDAATNSSTPGVVEYEPTRVRMCTGNNHYEGYVARWTDIDPGADGTFKVRVQADANAESSGQKAYAFDVFMLEEITQTVSVPNVVGMAQADANSAITTVGLVVGTITTQCSNTVPAGEVISQDPVSGSSVPPGSAVDMVVSRGQPTVPDVTGMDEATAIATINADPDLSYGSSSTECSDTVPSGDVISYSPIGTVACSTVVDLAVSRGQPTVPVLTGMTEAAAIAALNADPDLSYGSSTDQCSDTVPADEVISYSPTGTVACGTSVDLVVSRGQPTVPNLTGMDEANAIAALTADPDLSYGSSTHQCSNTVPAGEVISYSPTGTVDCGTVVDLVVSDGQPTVPNVTGMDESDAIDAINAVPYISYGSSIYQCSNTVPADEVISQTAAGTVPCGTVVNLVVSRGQPTVPDVTGMSEAAAIAAINADPDLSYGSSSTACSDTVPAGDVISYSPTGTVACGTVVDLVISRGQPTVPVLTGMTEAAAIAAINADPDLSYGSSSTACSDTVPAGDVISYSPTGTVACGTVVDLVVSRGQPTVPVLTGMTEAAAIAALTADPDLSYGSSSTACSDTVPAGDVISYSPSGVVPCGTVVDLVISRGQPTVPDVTGMSEAAAIAAINADPDLSYGSSSTQCSNTVPMGDVISYSPSGVVPCGTVVNLVVSTGPCGADVVPDVIGMTQADANTAILAVSPLQVGTITHQYDNIVAAGIVMDQDPVGGTEVADINLAPSCVGHWKMNDNEPDTTVLDSSSAGNDGTSV
ncbi:MAG: PASTA domain-containing protein, partial [Sedimentisphaerales bacterium]|nr:PASTA domain-containing protein [Sedimentisphaerales bacterium]